MMMSNAIDGKISNKLYLACNKITEISVLSEILDRYYDGFKINNKTWAFSFVIQCLIKDLFCDLYIIIFDYSPSNEGFSLVNIKKDIDNNRKFFADRLCNYEKEFDSVQKNFDEIRVKLQRIKQYRDKHHAHLDYVSVKKQDEEFLPSWFDFKNCLTKAKKIHEAMSLFWDGSSSDFGESQYSELRDLFWECVNIPNSTNL